VGNEAQWAAACESAHWPTGTFARAYEANRRAAVEGVIEADPVAAGVRELTAVELPPLVRHPVVGGCRDLLVYSP
jgi:hypothetical protein